MILSEKENDDAHAFASAHYARQCRSPWLRRKPQRAAVKIIAQSTGIGYGIKVECPNCGEQRDITDYKCW